MENSGYVTYKIDHAGNMKWQVIERVWKDEKHTFKTLIEDGFAECLRFKIQKEKTA